LTYDFRNRSLLRHSRRQFFCALVIGLVCIARPVIAGLLPADQPINKSAGRGGPLTVKVRLESGEELGFIVDSGSPATVFDKSLERVLGKRVGTLPMSKIGERWQKANAFRAPKIYLGGAELKTDPLVYAYDFKRQFMGILGMDVLRNYCVQLDFKAGRMRFLAPEQVNTGELGKALPLNLSPIHGTNDSFVSPEILFGGLPGNGGTPMVIDLGCGPDGLLAKGTNNFGGVFLPEFVWEGVTYTNLLFGAPGHANALGLRFLARHLVTMDFPRQTLYLKPTRSGALDESTVGFAGESARSSALKYLLGMKERGALPGWQAGGKEPLYFNHLFNTDSKSQTFWLRTERISWTTHYKLTRPTKEGAWKLQKAWRTDERGRRIETLALPGR